LCELKTDEPGRGTEKGGVGVVPGKVQIFRNSKSGSNRVQTAGFVCGQEGHVRDGGRTRENFTPLGRKGDWTYNHLELESLEGKNVQRFAREVRGCFDEKGNETRPGKVGRKEKKKGEE